jgi:hypothetical protein
MLKDDSLPCRKSVDLLEDTAALQQLAKESGFLRRSPRKVAPGDFIKAVMLAGAQGSVSFNSLARQAGRVSGMTSSRQNMARRCGAAAVCFLRGAVALALQRGGPAASPVTTAFSRVVIHDGSLIRLADSAREHFPAVSSSDADKAMLRLQFAYDYSSGKTLFANLDPYARTDAAAAGDLMAHLQPGDLCLRDLGYYKAAWFQQMDAIGAFYLSRLKSEVTVCGSAGKAIALDKFLQAAKGDLVDATVRLGAAGDFTTRLVAIRVPREVAEQRRRKLHEKAKRRNQTPSALKLALADWLLLVTNIPPEKAGAEALRHLYSLRWHVELVFKTFKGNGCLRQLAGHASNPHHLETLLLGQLLQVILNLRLWRTLSAPHAGRPLSLLKVAGLIRETLEILWLPVAAANAWRAHLQRILYHCRYDRRQLKNLEILHSELLR